MLKVARIFEGVFVGAAAIILGMIWLVGKLALYALGAIALLYVVLMIVSGSFHHLLLFALLAVGILTVVSLFSAGPPIQTRPRRT